MKLSLYLAETRRQNALQAKRCRCLIVRHSKHLHVYLPGIALAAECSVHEADPSGGGADTGLFHFLASVDQGPHESAGTPWYTSSASEGKCTHPLLGCPKRCIQARDLDVVNFIACTKGLSPIWVILESIHRSERFSFVVISTVNLFYRSKSRSGK